MPSPSLFAESDNPERSITAPPPSPNSHRARTNEFESTTSLYRKYRPRSFDAEDLVGQDHVVRTLRNAIALDRVAHAYLFSGPRGTGKTTTARLLAKAVNCLDPDPGQRPCNTCLNCQAINGNATADIIEIDAASNRGIDDIRDLRERVRYAPSQLPSKVYIIDEAHQITGAAANAFLKTLEEPPPHSRFILATTDPEELLPTIVSRCQHFEFRRVNTDDIARRLRTVADLESVPIRDDALVTIARHATGSLRDALGLLEQLALARDTASADGPPIDSQSVQAALGLSRNERIEQLVVALGQRNAGEALRVVQRAIDDGEDARQLNRQLLGYIRLLMIERSGGAIDADERARELAATFSLGQLAAFARRFGEIDFSIKHAPFPQLPLEVAIVEAVGSPDLDGNVAEATPASPAVAANEVPRPTSLRERVRGTSSLREAPPLPPQTLVQPEPTPISSRRPEPGNPSPSPQSVSAATGSLDVEQIADLWPNVRADVKALNRRIEALLSEVDPVGISGNQITLAAPYPFHRDKLNSEEVRETIATVLSRLLSREVSVTCILRGEFSGTRSDIPRAHPQVVAVADIAPEEQSIPSDEERSRARLTAAKNIFDAEEIADPALATEANPVEQR